FTEVMMHKPQSAGIGAERQCSDLGSPLGELCIIIGLYMVRIPQGMHYIPCCGVVLLFSLLYFFF
ncbi:hypothetical protein, partial [Cytophaga sp. FL35]|uniref:hypothetical protein n=1 Tax=Cytophaga sp. FL35 TaxID=1904456 RepID=UPI001CA40D7C